MKDKYDKEISKFTDPQKQALKAVIKKISERGGRTSKQKLINAIRKKGCYSRPQDRKKCLKMLLKNPKVPLSLEGHKIVRTDLKKEVKT